MNAVPRKQTTRTLELADILGTISSRANVPEREPLSVSLSALMELIMTRAMTMSILVAVLLSAGCASSPEQHFIRSVKNKPARDFELKDLSDKLVSLRDFRGKPILVAFFAYG